MLNCFQEKDFFLWKNLFSRLSSSILCWIFCRFYRFFEKNTGEFNNPNALTCLIRCRWKNSALIQILSIITLCLSARQKNTEFENQTFAWVRCFQTRNTTAPSWWIIEHNEAQNVVQRIFFSANFHRVSVHQKFCFVVFQSRTRCFCLKKVSSTKKIVFNICAPFELLWN